MRKEMIELYVAQLRRSFGQPRPPVDDTEFEKLFKNKDWESMTGRMQKVMGLDMRLFLGLVNRGGPATAPAWITTEGDDMPLYGTPAFRAMSVTMYLRKSFLADATFERTMIAISHELSHVVLYSTRHNLRYEEEAVDLTAMFFGFRDFYVTGCRRVVIKQVNALVALRKVETISYLTQEEVSYAAELMVSNRLR